MYSRDARGQGQRPLSHDAGDSGPQYVFEGSHVWTRQDYLSMVLSLMEARRLASAQVSALMDARARPVSNLNRIE